MASSPGRHTIPCRSTVSSDSSSTRLVNPESRPDLAPQHTLFKWAGAAGIKGYNSQRIHSNPAWTHLNISGITGPSWPLWDWPRLQAGLCLFSPPCASSTVLGVPRSARRGGLPNPGLRTLSGPAASAGFQRSPPTQGRACGGPRLRGGILKTLSRSGGGGFPDAFTFLLLRSHSPASLLKPPLPS